MIGLLDMLIMRYDPLEGGANVDGCDLLDAETTI